MKTNSREILLYYNPESSSDRRTVAHAKSLSPYIKSYAYGQTPSTETSWRMILKALKVHPKDLLNKSHPYYQQHIRGRNFDAESWIKVIQNNPDILRVPIAVRGNRAVLCNNPTDIYKLGKLV